MSTRRLIAGNTLIQLIGKAATASATLLVTMLVTRHFGPAGFGDFIIMITFPTLFWIMGDFGFNATVVREITKDPKKTQSYFANLLLLRLGLASVFTVMALVILRLLPYSPLVKWGVSINLGTLWLMSVFTSAQAIFQVNLKYLYSVIGQIAGALLNLILVWLVIYWGGSLLWVGVSSLAGNLLMAVIALFLVSRFVRLDQLHWQPALAKALFIATLPIGLALIFDILVVKIDSVLLSFLPLPGLASNSAAVGYYGTAYKIFEVILTVPTFFMAAAYPILVRYLNDDPQAARDLFRKSLLVLGGLSLLAVMVGFPLSPLAIRFLAGTEFGLAIGALQILLLGLPFFFISSLLMQTLWALEKQRLLPRVYAVALVLNVVLNLIFIPRYSFTAAAVATGVTEVFILLWLSIMLWRNWSISFNR